MEEIKNKTINIDYITKIEGHAKLSLCVENSELKSVDLDVFTGARYFEAMVVDKRYDEIPEITQRICSICSPVHNVAAATAIENALDIKVSEQTKLLRELLCIGGIVQSHVLHIFFLALPDYTGHNNAIEMASTHKDAVVKALKLKKYGNLITQTVGGREIHQVTTAIGGFKSIPTQKQIDDLLKESLEAKKMAIDAAKIFAAIQYPDFYRQTIYISLHSDKYPMMEGLIKFQEKLIKPEDYDKHIKEIIEFSSVAKEARFDKETYNTSALARMNDNHDKLSADARKILNESKIQFPTNNSYMNTFAQALEVLHFIDRAIEILSTLKVDRKEKPVKFKLKAGRGVCVIEAPRGILIHDYTLDAHGFVKKANIITPTSQNLHNIELDLKKRIPAIISLGEDAIRHESEKLIRAYDPCISCSTHFLEIEWKK